MIGGEVNGLVHAEVVEVEIDVRPDEQIVQADLDPLDQ